MMLKQVYRQMKTLVTPHKKDYVFLFFLLLSMFLWSMDITFTRHQVWKHGIGIELDPRTIELYGVIGDRVFDVGYGFYLSLHTFLWILYRRLQVTGWLFLMSLLAVTVYTNFFNFFLSGLLF